MTLTLDAAQLIIAEALAKGRELGLKPLTVAAPVPGGVLIRNDTGIIIGAVGITGDSSDNDEICAITGIEAIGFVADPG